MSAPNLIYPPSSGGGGGGVSGSGTPNFLPIWNGASNLTDSPLSFSGSTLTTSAALNAINFSAATQTWTLPNNGFALTIQGTSGNGTLKLDTNNRYVGIDSPSGPADKLHIAETGPLAFRMQNVSASTYWQHKVDASGNWGLAVNGGTAALTVNSSGNFGIGTAAPQELAQVAGNLKIGTTATNSFLTFGDEGTTSRFNGIYRPASSNTLSVGSYNLITFNVSASALGSQTERARIDSSGNVILNAANTGATIQAAGSQQGLKLPATPGNTDPNTLDCYADGGTANSGGVTWTPALRFGGASTGITGSQVGRYTRIGNMVFAQGTLALSSKGSAVGAASISGLPTSANVAATIYYSISIGYNSKVTFTGQLHGLISVNSGIVELYQTSTAGVVSAVANSDFANDSVLTFTVCYPVT